MPKANAPTTPPHDTINAEQFAHNMAKAGELWQRVLQELSAKAMRKPVAVGHTDPLAFGESILHTLRNVSVDPVTLAQSQLALVHDHLKLMQSTTAKLLGKPAETATQAPIKDRRFKDETWEKSPLYDYVKQSYLLNARWLQQSVGNIQGLSAQEARKLSFFTRQFIDAMAPSNFPATNPEVIRATLESNGDNIVNGLQNFLDDFSKGDGRLRISMTDENAFTLGENIACTKGSVVYQNELMQLIQYAPTTKTVYQTPLLLTPAWINKYYVLDLRPENSCAKYLVDQGYTVFVISWVNPDEKLGRKSFEDYLKLGPLAAIDVIAAITGEKKVALAGYCLGGTLTAIALAWLRATGQEKRVAAATYLTTLVDFTDAGDISVFIDDTQLSALEERMNDQGYLEADDMANTFNMLRANDLIWSFVINNYLMGKQPFPFDLLYWNSDATRMPATMHAFYLRNMYQRNLLAKPNGITLAGEPINLTKITTPTYVLATREDHIAPWKSAYLATQMYDGDVTFTLTDSGHIAGVINPPSKQKYCYWVNAKLPPKAEDWFAGAKEIAGSWWPHWHAWQKQRVGSMVKARKVGSAKFKPIEPAPGSYAKVRA